MLEDGLGDRADALSEVVDAPVGRVVADHRDAALWTVPLGVMNSNETITGRVTCLLTGADARGHRRPLAVATVMLPVGDPVDEHLPDLDISNRDFFNRINFQTWRVQHLLNCSRRTFEDTERYHLIKPNWHLRIMFLAFNLHHFLLMHLIYVFA